MSAYIRNITRAFGPPSPSTYDQAGAETRPATGLEKFAAFFAHEALYGPPENGFYVVDDQGVTRPRDPVTGDILRAGDIPPSLMYDEGMRRGFQFLIDHGRELRLRILLTRHIRFDDLTRSAIDLPREALRLSAGGGVLFIEGVGTTEGIAVEQRNYSAAAHARPAEAALYRRAFASIAEHEPDAAFKAGIATALISTGVTVRSPDIVRDSPRIPDQAATAMLDYADSIVLTPDIATSVEYARATMAADFYRDMCIVGRMAEEMAAAFEATGRLTERALLIGNLHQYMGNIFKRYGAEVTFAGQEPEEGAGRIQMRWVEKAAITLNDFAAIASQ